jgi:sulfite exporter TauE/SafE
MNEILWPFFIGLAGSLHCLGMCGPLVVAYSLEAAQGVRASAAGAGSISSTLACHLAFHTGRVITYGIVGAVAGGFFEAADLGRFSHHFRSYLWAGGGVLLVLFGLAMLKVVPFPRFLTAGFGNPDSFLLSRPYPPSC